MLWILLKTKQGNGESGIVLVWVCVDKKVGIQQSRGERKSEISFIGIHKACPKEVCKGLIRKENRMV